MNKKTKIPYILLIFNVVNVGIIGTHNVVAEQPKRQQVTAASLVSDVLSHNPELRLYEAQIKAAHGDRITAEQWANPELSSTLGNKHISGGDDGASWSISFTQTFDWPGRRTLRKLIAENEIERAELELALFRSALKSEARTAIFDLLGAQENLGALREVSKRYTELSEILSKRDTPGVNPILERRIIEATGFALSRKIIEAEIENRKAHLRINELRGESLTDDFEIKPSKLKLRAAPSFSELLEAARTNNFELQVNHSQLKQEGLKLDLAKNERNPSFAVGPYVSNERAGDLETQIGIGVSIPLPLWDRNEGHISTEAARKDQVEASLKSTERKIEREIAESLEVYKLRLGELEKANGLSVDDFKKAAALADENYRLGAVPVTTYVELQKQYLEAVETYLDIKRDALRARQHLELLTGLTLDETSATNSLRDGGRND